MHKSMLAIIAILVLLTGTAYAEPVQTSWQHACTEPDLAGFKVYQSANPGGPFTGTPLIVNGCTLSATLDPLTVPNSSFVVTSFDTSGNESALSNVASTVRPLASSHVDQYGTWELYGNVAPYNVKRPDGTVDPDGAWVKTIQVVSNTAYLQWAKDDSWWHWSGSGWVLDPNGPQGPTQPADTTAPAVPTNLQAS